MGNSCLRCDKHFDLSHLQELADVLIPFVLEPCGSGIREYIQTHPIKPLEEHFK